MPCLLGDRSFSFAHDYTIKRIWKRNHLIQTKCLKKYSKTSPHRISVGMLKDEIYSRIKLNSFKMKQNKMKNTPKSIVITSKGALFFLDNVNHIYLLLFLDGQYTSKIYPLPLFFQCIFLSNKQNRIHIISKHVGNFLSRAVSLNRHNYEVNNIDATPNLSYLFRTPSKGNFKLPVDYGQRRKKWKTEKLFQNIFLDLQALISLISSYWCQYKSIIQAYKLFLCFNALKSK